MKRISKKDLERRIEKIEDSIGFEGKVYVCGIGMDISEAIHLLAAQFGSELTFSINKQDGTS